MEEENIFFELDKNIFLRYLSNEMFRTGKVYNQGPSILGQASALSIPKHG